MIIYYTIESSFGHTVTEDTFEATVPTMTDRFEEMRRTLRNHENRENGESEYLYIGVNYTNATALEEDLFSVLGEYYDIELN